MFRLGKLRITPGVLVLLAVSCLAGAGEVLPLVFLAAFLHELAHIAALAFAGSNVEGIYLTAFGAEIQADTRFLPYGKDILCTLAGPFANIFLGVILSRVSADYLFAGANLLQGIFNLLPLAGMDGARALHLAISWAVDPPAADRICRGVEIVCSAALLLISVYFVAAGQAGVFLLFAAVGIFGTAVAGWRGK